MQPSAILVAARALIPTEAEWWHIRDGRLAGQNCPLAAIAIAATNMMPRGNYSPACGSASEYLRIAAGVRHVIDWNHAPQRTLAEVHAAFDLAADMALVNGE